MPFLFKQKSFDFIVSEQLPFAPSGHGDALYVYFEKQNMTTQQVIRHLRNQFGLTRLTLGIAGLKDKKALTRQRITIYDSALEKLGGERVFINSLKEIVKVLEVTRHEFPIGMSTPISNQFHIRLRSVGKLSKDEKVHALDFATKTLRE
ncbi:MAG: tRNA pseudouridine(13) synthase TruD [Candidatus Peribacteria bacterium]|nr:MAG: tRNA pseudouridine(13) synthase TruD [Candidatus Peribacteria bacterium]